MKVWEALDLLRDIDPNAEVVISFGPGTKSRGQVIPPVVSPYPHIENPSMDYKYVPWHNTITCKTAH